MRSLLVLVLSCGTAANAQPQYDFVDLGVPPGHSNCSVRDIDEQNRAIVIVQTATPSPFGSKGYLWDNGVFTEIGPYAAYARTEPAKLGPGGAIVGSAWQKSGEWPVTTVGWIWKNGSFTALPNLGSNATNALSINSSGLCTGWSYPTNIFQTFAHAYKATPSSIQHIGDVRLLSSTGYDINDAGQLAASGPGLVEFTWESGMVTSPEGGLFEIGSLGGISYMRTSVSAINNAGQIVGSSTIGGGPKATPFRHAYVWQEGVMKDLGTLPGDDISTASNINEAGVIVGSSGPFATARPCMWTDGQIVDLTAQTTIPAGWQTKIAVGITEQGVIIGRGTLAGQTRSFMLVPKP